VSERATLSAKIQQIAPQFSTPTGRAAYFVADV
jgi:hypothetical protein